MRVVHRGQILTVNDHQANQWSTQTKVLVGSAVVILLALAAMKAANLYTHHQNGNIESINCHFGEKVNGVVRNFNYYENAAKKGAEASDQYCFAQMHETGNGTAKNLGEARNWYKKAAEQGLTLAARLLCRSSMYEHRWGTFEEYDQYAEIFSGYRLEFSDICCPPLSPTSLGLPPRCPWQKQYW